MDKLVKYIETRRKRYGHIKGEQAIYSIYYTIGNKIVRISDHMKYSLKSMKTFDYSFILQPGDLYIFSMSPNNVDDGKLYLKIMTLDEVKKFIRKLHEFAIVMDDMCEIYRPDGWNKNDGTQYEKPSWNDFYLNYLDGETDMVKVNILDKIELIHYGALQKGKIDEKLSRVPVIYENLSLTQYDTLLKKMENIVGS